MEKREGWCVTASPAETAVDWDLPEDAQVRQLTRDEWIWLELDRIDLRDRQRCKSELRWIVAAYVFGVGVGVGMALAVDWYKGSGLQ